jgi:hypothetical protein
MKRYLVGVALLAGCLLWVGDVGATSQFSRKEGVSCTTCHQGFPRLNEFGEKYMRAGYKVPDTKSVHDGEKMSLEKVSDYFGVRLNVDAVSWEDGVPDSTISFGEDLWTQFFVAGNIADRVSFFTEIEITTHGTHHSWWKLGYHGDSQKFNLTLGNQSPVDHSAYSNRLRILPAVKSELYGLKTSTDGADPDGAGVGFDPVESVNASSARPAIQAFGDVGKFVYYAGISNARGDVSDAINTWGGLRWYFPTEGKLAGSSISATYYQGSDVYGAGPTQVENEFSWWMPAVNIRAGGFDLQAYGRFASEDNYTLVPFPPAVPPELSEDWDGWGLVAGWMINDRWQPAIMYDKIDISAITSESEWITAALSYFPLENLRIAAYYRTDEVIDDNDRFFINLRMMF